MSGHMAMNVSDMQALQFVINAEASGHFATPRDISRYLGISTASTTKLLDRLSDSGRLERHPHPTDRRALTLRATPEAHQQMQAHMSRMHSRMEEIVTAIPEESRGVVVEFLNSMANYLESEDGSDSLD
jgi:DNA-binding MarR family transcriptional regulator